MRSLAWILLWMFFVETAADLNLPQTGLHVLEAWRRWTFNIPTKELRDFPECGVPTSAYRPCTPQSPCLLDEGPCDTDDDCEEPFTCGPASEKCKERSISAVSKCCIGKSRLTKKISSRVVQLECSSFNTCFEGQGTCAGDDGCSGNLVCGEADDQACADAGSRCCKCPESPPTPSTEPNCTQIGSGKVCTTTVTLDYVNGQSNIKLNTTSYPDKYEAGTKESFVIKAKDGRSYIRIFFLDFKVECENANITITQYNITQGTDEDLIDKECKAIEGGVTVIESERPTLNITFTTNGNAKERGFLFRASLIEGPKIEQIVDLNSTAVEKQFSSTNSFDIDANVSTNNYTANSVETWSIKSKGPKGRIRIEFLEFEVELSENCTNDHLNITEAGSTEALMKNTCGCQLPPSVETSEGVSEVTVTFNSSYSVTRQGFKFNASVVADTPENLPITTINLRRDRSNTKLWETFESQNYGAYKENIIEVFNIIAEDKNNPIKIEFLDFELEPACQGGVGDDEEGGGEGSRAKECQCDYVNITEENGSELLGKQCGIPTDIALLTKSSKSHNVTLTFVSDYAETGKGFRVNASLECPDQNSTNNRVTLTQGDSSRVFSSSNFPDNYNLNSIEVFIIENGDQGNSMIKLEFIEFQTEENYDNITITQDDGKELLNVTSGSVSTLGQLDVESASSKITVKFVSDCLQTEKGFKFRAVLVDKVEPNCRTQTGVTFEGDTYEELSKCQTVATIRQESRVFTSQNYPSNYDLNSVESFNMRAEDDSRKIKIEFLAFDLEESTNCEKDYVNINEGEATVTQQEFTLGQEERLFFSSNYPEKYNNNSQESFIIKAKDGFKIKVKFIDFELESSDTGCAYDYVNITEGENVLQDKVCGCDKPNNGNDITSTTSEIDVRLFSDYSVATRGFKLSASVDAEQPVEKEAVTKILSRKTRSTDVAEISSSGYDSGQNYDVNVKETYVVKTDDGMSWIKIKFLDFSVEPSSSKSNSTDCSSSKNRFDYVWITESDGTEILPKTCGNAAIPDILSKTQEVTVHFFSDYASAYRGFKLEATLVDADPTLSSQSREIGPDGDAIEMKTKNFPCNYNSNERENFTIKTETGNWVKIEFLEFELQEATTSPLQTDACLNDYVIITQKEGTTETTLMYPVCGNKKPRPLESNSSQVTLSFISDYTKTSKGFKFTATSVPNYREIDINTSEIDLMDTSRIVTSENYPHNYNSKTGKTIVINAKDDESSIKIEFLDFEVPTVPSDPGRHPSQCPKDYVTIAEKDGTSETTLLEKSCGKNLPEPVESTEMSNMLSIKFSSESDVTGRGFKFRATNVPKLLTICESEEEEGCIDDDLIGYSDQRNYTTEIKLDQNGESRIFTSLNYPADYRSNTSQTITFENPDKTTGFLRIEFIEFQVQDDPTATVDCPCDYVNIIDEETGDEILPNTCGFELPNTITTYAARFSLCFNTDISTSFRGFKVRVMFIKTSEEVDTCEDERVTIGPTEGGANRQVSPATCADNPSGTTASCFGTCVETRVNNKTNKRREITTRLDKTCAPSALPSITSESPLVSLNFFSDSDIQGSGFKFRASLETQTPDDETTTIRLHTNNTMIEESVEAKVNTNHRYHIVGEDLTSRIKIEFQEFRMSNDSECRYDYVNIIQLDGVGDNVLLQKSCGSKDNLPAKVESTAQTVTLNFYSDYNVGNDALKFKASLIAPGAEAGTETPTEVNTESLRVDTDLEFTSNSTANTERNFIITAGNKNKRIQLNFTDFNVNCPHTVKITQLDGVGDNILLNKTCRSKPEPIKSTEPEVTLQFTSISDDVVSSFTVSVSLIDTKCELGKSEVEVNSIDSSETRFSYTKTNCRGTINDLDCCSAQNPCSLGEGDCDEDFHCQGELRCGSNNCKYFSLIASEDTDCCHYDNSTEVECTSSLPTATITVVPDCPYMSAFKSGQAQQLEIRNEDPETAPEIRSHYESQDPYPKSVFRMVEVSVPLELEASIQLKFTAFPSQTDDDNCGVVTDTDDTGTESDAKTCCEWVAIWDCETRVLDKTCSKDLESLKDNLITWYTRSVQVYIYSDGLKNNQKGWTLTKSVIETPRFPLPNPSGCMYDCTWQPNPFYRRSAWMSLPRNKASVSTISVIFTAPQIPNNLTCLEDCFNEAKENRLILQAHCKHIALKKYYLTRTDVEENLNCLMYYYMTDPPNYKPTQVEGLKDSRKKKSIRIDTFHPIDDPKNGTLTLNYHLLPRLSVLEMALQFCIMANLENRKRLPTLVEEGKNLFNPPTELFRKKNCSSILPDLYEKETVVKKIGTRTFGPSSSVVERTGGSNVTYPWMCSLKTSGFRGRHRCGVTLLSGKPSPRSPNYNTVLKDFQDAPTIFVGAAHCNYICKDKSKLEARGLEVCCCRKPEAVTSCARNSLNPSSYCPANSNDAQLELAKPSDFQITCTQFTVGTVPESQTEENEVVLEVTKITNHPKYSPGLPEDIGPNLKGPINGSDISVYHVDDRNFRLNESYIWPACLPRTLPRTPDEQKKDFFTGWIDSEPHYKQRKGSRITVHEHNERYFHPRQHQVTLQKCSDPGWMRSQTYYPPGTLCYKDPTEASCFRFGNSGSSVMTHFKNATNVSKFAFTGPLSLHKGCDQVWELDSGLIYGSENPGVFTDARCYMRWIAAQYGLKMAASYTPPQSCFGVGKGDITDINKDKCQVLTDFYVKKNVLTKCSSDLNPNRIKQKNVTNKKGNKKKSTKRKGIKKKGNKNKLIKRKHRRTRQSRARKGDRNNIVSCKDGLGASTFEEKCEKEEIDGCTNEVMEYISGRGDQWKRNQCDWSQTYTDPTTNQTQPWDRCLLLGTEGFSYNVYRCKNIYGEIGTCSNNCKGVDPNAIIIGGSALLAVSSVALTSPFLAAAVPLGAGVMAMANSCLASQGMCRTRPRRGRPSQCCRIRERRGRRYCPRRC